jgi:hypothetical protein
MTPWGAVREILTSLSALAGLHASAARGALHGPELDQYRQERESLTRVLLQLQHAGLDGEQQPRRALRVSRAVPARLLSKGQVVQTPTLDLSSGGFAAVFHCSLQVGEELDVELLLPDGGPPVQMRARTTDVRQHREGGLVRRVGFALLDGSPADLERIEEFVFGAVLEQLLGALPDAPRPHDG